MCACIHLCAHMLSSERREFVEGRCAHIPSARSPRQWNYIWWHL